MNNQDVKPAKSESLWIRMLNAWARSFDLLAEAKSRFPLET